MTPRLDRLSDPGVHTLDSVRGAYDLPDVVSEREERHELRPRVLPQPDDGWATGLPAFSERGQAAQGGCPGGGGVDGLEVFRDGRPGLASGGSGTTGRYGHS